MDDSALIVSQSGQLTRGLETLALARGYDPVSTLVTTRSTDEQYYISPETVAQLERRIADTDGQDMTVIVDGVLHPGQLTDLQRRLQTVTIRDKRRVVWERLAGGNTVAATLADLQAARIARRQALDSQREAATQSPSGTSGQVADIERRLTELRNALETQQQSARQRVQTGYEAADATVVLLGRVEAPTTALWEALTGESATAEAGRPARPVTGTATIGPHYLAVTETPGVPGSDGLPEWLTQAVPGLPAALGQATCVLGVGEGHDSLLRAVSERFDVACQSLGVADAAEARAVLEDTLQATTCAVRLPYSDDAHALVSALHDQTVVEAVEYGDEISLRVAVSRTATDKLRRQVDAVDGQLDVLDTD